MRRISLAAAATVLFIGPALIANTPGQGPRATYPPCAAPYSGADLRGKMGPALEVQSWITPKPDTRNKVLIIDFWATWCGPCRAAIPHMNALATKFNDSVVAVALSDEAPGKLQSFMQKTKFAYSVATDPARRMATFSGHKGIPTVMIMSPDGIVRWQGHPMELEEATLRQIVEASGAGASAMR